MKNLGISLISVLFALLLGELILRLVPVEDPYYGQKYPPVLNGYIRSQFQPGMKLSFSTEEGLPGFEGNGTTSFTVNSVGFRGDELGRTGEFRIFTVGGSTTECLYLDDDQHWPYLLQNHFERSGLDVNVQNAGKSGDAVDDHIAMMAHRIVHLDPDLVIIYMGVNDVLRLVCNKNPLKFDQPGEKIPVFKHFLSEFQLYRRLHNVFSKNRNKSDIAMESDYAMKAEHARRLSETDSIPALDYDYLKRKVDILISICKASGKETVFIPQLTAWGTDDEALEKWFWLTEICGNRYNDDVLAGLMEKVNEVVIESCREHNVPVIQLNMEPRTANFYDDCHFNPAGAQLFARTVFDSLRVKIDSFPDLHWN